MRVHWLCIATAAMLPFTVGLRANEEEIHLESETTRVDQVSEEKEDTTIDVRLISLHTGHKVAEMAQPPFQLDLDAIIEGMHAAARGEPLPMEEAEYARQTRLLQEQALQAMHEKQLHETEAFMREKAAQPGVVSLAEGKVLLTEEEPGEGPAVTREGEILIDYVARNADGHVFSSSEGTPVRLSLAEVVPGIALALEGAKTGSKREIFLHPDMGYMGTQLGAGVVHFSIHVVDAAPPAAEDDEEDDVEESAQDAS